MVPPGFAGAAVLLDRGRPAWITADAFSRALSAATPGPAVAALAPALAGAARRAVEAMALLEACDAATGPVLTAFLADVAAVLGAAVLTVVLLGAAVLGAAVLAVRWRSGLDVVGSGQLPADAFGWSRRDLLGAIRSGPLSIGFGSARLGGSFCTCFDAVPISIGFTCRPRAASSSRFLRLTASLLSKVPRAGAFLAGRTPAIPGCEPACGSCSYWIVAGCFAPACGLPPDLGGA